MFWGLGLFKAEFCWVFLTLDISLLPICIGIITIVFIHIVHNRKHHKSAWKIKLQ